MKLSDYCQIINGHSFRGKINEVDDGNVSVVQLSDINELTGVCYESLMRTSYDGKKSEAFLNDGDILCVSKGPRLYAVTLEDVPEYTLATYHMSIIRVNREIAIPGYVTWLLNNSQRYYQQNSQGGSGVTHMNKLQLGNLSIELPNIENQQAIVELEKLKRKENQILERLLRTRDVLTLACQKKLSTNQIRRNK